MIGGHSPVVYLEEIVSPVRLTVSSALRKGADANEKTNVLEDIRS